MVYKQPKSKNWSYKFMWDGRLIRKSTKQANKRVAEHMESAHRTALAKGEVGIREKVKAPVLGEFIDADFLPYVERTFPEKDTEGRKTGSTAEFYACCAENLKSFKKIANARLDEIGHDLIQAFIDYRKENRFEYRKGKGRVQVSDGKPLQVSTLNRDLATLRKMLKLAVEWGRISAAPKVRLLPGENHRDRALSAAEEAAYIKAATDVGHDLEKAYEAALTGIRAVQRGEQPRKPDAFHLCDVAIIMLDAGLRPHECYWLKPEDVRDGAIWAHGKTEAGDRRIPIMTERLRGVLDMRLSRTAPGGWLFPADTKSGHIEESSLKRDHAKALAATSVVPFDLYILRHTCLTNWGEWMDPFRLRQYAGHKDLKTTMRYIHPREESPEEAMRKATAAREARLARGGHTSGHTAQNGESDAPAESAAIN